MEVPLVPRQVLRWEFSLRLLAGAIVVLSWCSRSVVFGLTVSIVVALIAASVRTRVFRNREVGVGYPAGRPELASGRSSPGIPFWNYYSPDPHNRAFLLTHSHELASVRENRS